MRSLLALLFLTPLFACQSGGGAKGPFKVVGTTTMVVDMVRQVAGHRVSVQGLLAPGGDPHVYRPLPADAQAVAGAQLIFSNGLHLEPWLPDLIRQSGSQGRLVAVAEGLKTRVSPQDKSVPDPHVWFDVRRWKQAVGRVERALSEFDPAGQTTFSANARLYERQLTVLDDWVQAQVGRIPKARRKLVTSHDAFAYFGEAYGFEVVPLQGISTESEASTRDMARVVEIVRGASVPMVFVETSVNSRLIEQVARETGVRVGGPLYSDSLGVLESSAGTYTGMVRDNVALMVEGLQ
ncbi:MAG: zinc ABC transporter substrate-binding protein [Candidatus Sericytochromatia bacterium]|nr:zinc ABC transporter substrate-binding protein [Candidatus Sericytochromatia bacterium]